MEIQIQQSATSTLDTESKGFSVDGSAKAFKVLASSLYTNKPLAVIRELSMNAIDAHRMADKADIPFKITMPTEMSPELIVEDFGVGMACDFIDNYYTRAFYSTKDNNNIEGGAFGIGRLSSFSISDSFVVESNKDNMKTVALIYNDGLPKVNIISHEKTNESNGTKVKIPVSNYNTVDNLNVAVSEFFKWMDLKPEVINHKHKKDWSYSTTFEKESENVYVEHNDSFRHINSELNNLTYFTSYFKINNVILDSVNYEIPSSIIDTIIEKIKTKCSDLNMTFMIDRVSDRIYYKKILINMPLGSIELSPSRETIEDSNFNIESISEAYYQYFKDQVKNKIPKLLQDFKDIHQTLETMYDETKDMCLLEKFDLLNDGLTDNIQRLNWSYNSVLDAESVEQEIKDELSEYYEKCFKYLMPSIFDELDKESLLYPRNNEILHYYDSPNMQRIEYIKFHHKDDHLSYKKKREHQPYMSHNLYVNYIVGDLSFKATRVRNSVMKELIDLDGMNSDNTCLLKANSKYVEDLKKYHKASRFWTSDELEKYYPLIKKSPKVIKNKAPKVKRNQQIVGKGISLNKGKVERFDIKMYELYEEILKEKVYAVRSSNYCYEYLNTFIKAYKILRQEDIKVIWINSRHTKTKKFQKEDTSNIVWLIDQDINNKNSHRLYSSNIVLDTDIINKDILRSIKKIILNKELFKGTYSNNVKKYYKFLDKPERELIRYFIENKGIVDFNNYIKTLSKDLDISSLKNTFEYKIYSEINEIKWNLDIKTLNSVYNEKEVIKRIKNKIEEEIDNV